MFTVLTCIRDEHDLRLVLLAAVICVTSAVTAMRFHRRNTSGVSSARDILGVLTAVVAGGGVWATHFIAMLAYHTSLPINYNLIVTSASLVVAIVGMGVGFALAAHRPAPLRQAAGGVLIGLSIAAMHFIGIAAIQSSFEINWRWDYVAVSVVLAVAGATAALFSGQRASGVRAWVLPPALLVLGIVGLHFTGMAAMDILPDLGAPKVQEVVSRGGLAVLTGAVTVLLISVAAGMVWIEARGRETGRRNLESAFQGVPAGLAMFDAAGKLVVWNEAYVRMMGEISIKPFTGATRYDLARQIVTAGVVTPEDGDHHAWASNVAAERKTGLLDEFPTTTGRWLRMEVADLPGGESVTVVTDISESKAFAKEMAQARDRAEAANRAKSEFLTNMSHEIRTPLNGILGMTQVMEADELTADQRGRLKVVKESGGALLDILNDLLDLSKVQAGKLELDVGDVDMGKLVRTVTAAFDGAASAKDIALTAVVNEGVGGLWRGDGVRLRQILANLVGNALKFTHEGEVRLSIERCNQGLEFRVVDTGIGVAEEHLPHLFEKFAQADSTTTRRYGGTGLGLAICQELVELMGGSISVRSELDKGSCFTVFVPTEYVGPSLAESDGAVSARAETSDMLHILAAEDNLTNQLVLRSLLEPLGCALTIVANGREAVAAAKQRLFDVILMDIQMPEMNGVEAALSIRAHERETGQRRTPIVALSANVMSHQIEEYTQSGMDHWVAKPIELEKLYAGLDLVLTQAEDTAEAAASPAAA